MQLGVTDTFIFYDGSKENSNLLDILGLRLNKFGIDALDEYDKKRSVNIKLAPKYKIKKLYKNTY